MRKLAVDTNVLLAFRFKREPFYKQAKGLIQRCTEGKIELYLSVPVFLELEWVLRSFYKQAKEEILPFLENLLLIDSLSMDDKNGAKMAVTLYKNNSKVNFTDCIIAQQIHSREYDFLTFDEDLKKLFQSL